MLKLGHLQRFQFEGCSNLRTQIIKQKLAGSLGPWRTEVEPCFDCRSRVRAFFVGDGGYTPIEESAFRCVVLGQLDDVTSTCTAQDLRIAVNTEPAQALEAIRVATQTAWSLGQSYIPTL